ncbi:MAG: hypothetical protein AAB401_12065, partial [Acidobacteriota bacterium]
MRLIKLLSFLFVLSVPLGVGRFLPQQSVSGQSGAVPGAPTGVTASDAAYSNRVGIIWDTVRN